MKWAQTLAIAVSVLLLIPSYSKQIAITFDDAPLDGSHIMTGEEKTKLIKNHLKENEVSDALFFVTTGHINTESDKRDFKLTLKRVLFGTS
ncbi:hypothetical protein HII17_06045 [Thalassotalea sp. M1531]|uniref:NodB homology domain-containing protein n=1 Tax=Thalassotalea algicola TaxID=2716224 RepID=A0A7Y0LBK7_9GAMM|nr:polysaccharide deacetylase family protein [Thalassotalea algicola]NMP31122.1 hypothetical protein [Thalassotalea algicola]